MKKSIGQGAFSGYTTAECMKLAKKVGFDGIQLGFGPGCEISIETSHEKIKEFKDLANEIGLGIVGFAGGLSIACPLSDPDEAVRRKCIEFTKKEIEVCSVLGGESVLLCAGVVGADFLPSYGPVPYDRAYENSVKSFAELSKTAKDFGVKLGAENCWTGFLLSPLEARQFIDEIGSEYVGIFFDVGNVMNVGYPEQWIKILGKDRITSIHLKDFRRSVGTIYGFVDLLEGDVNFPGVIKALREIGYDGYLTAEMSPYRHFSERVLYNTVGAIKDMLGEER